MKPTNEQIIAEARRRAKEQNWRMDIEEYVIEVVRENWTPPEPVDPDLLAFREWLANDPEVDAWTGGALLCRLGRHDNTEEARAYLAGARMAREQEQERAKEVLDQAKAIIDQHARLLARLPLGLRADMGIEWQTMMDTAASFYAKYRGES